MRISELIRLAFLIGLAALALVSMRVDARPDATVFVSIPPQKSMVQRIAGDLVHVEVLVPAGASPATHEPTGRQMMALSEAGAWFRIGVPFEETWAPRIKANFPELPVIDTRAGIELMTMGSHGGRPDPHIWLSPRLVLQQARTIRDALTGIWPQHAARFSAGHAAFAADLQTLDADLTARFGELGQRRFMIYHPALGYFARDYGLEQIAIEIHGQQPGPTSLTRIIEAARAADIHVIFVQQEFGKSAAEAVARAIDGEVVTISPLAENTLRNIREIAEALLQALE
ncbi:MAG: zinc ABC transporter substrate-binding protein [Wenzhouxiangella sp.]|jgi:zinc transport system substrate-binding protein|nr:zinc ABC transporter substrate-binding protein [Wenzhouxiangella sp.]